METMTKIVVLGDTHGRTSWKQIVEKETDFNIFVFIGDYFDSHQGITKDEQLDNFNEILEFKRNNDSRVVLLIGNHDYHYMPGIRESYSGYQTFARYDFEEALKVALRDNLLQMCYIHENLLFSHAGVTDTWLKSTGFVPSDKCMEEYINDLIKYQIQAFSFTEGRNFSMTGNDITQSPIWVRPESLVKDKLTKYTMIVGHTGVPDILLGNSVVLIDALRYNKYLVITDGVMSVETF